MKNLLLPLMASAVVVTACGGGESQPITLNLTPQTNENSINSGSAPATNTGQSLPANDPTQTSTQQQAAPSSTTTAPSTIIQTPTVQPEPGPCVDTTPLNDGWGWNGVGNCPLDIAPPTVAAPPLSQWGGRTWNCVSNVPEITARWQLLVNHDRTFVDLSRPIGDPLRTGTWSDRQNAGFTTLWADDRSFEYQSLGSGFIDDGGSRCHEDFYPARSSDLQNDAAAEESLPDLGDGEWEYPVFFCKAWSNPSNVWAWGFSEDGHLRDHNGIIAGSYLFQSQGLQMFINNQFDEQTQWSIVDGKSLTISWGGCAHVAGPTLREVDLSATTSDYCMACH